MEFEDKICCIGVMLERCVTITLDLEEVIKRLKKNVDIADDDPDVDSSRTSDKAEGPRESGAKRTTKQPKPNQSEDFDYY